MINSNICQPLFHLHRIRRKITRLPSTILQSFLQSLMNSSIFPIQRSTMTEKNTVAIKTRKHLIFCRLLTRDRVPITFNFNFRPVHSITRKKLLVYEIRIKLPAPRGKPDAPVSKNTRKEVAWQQTNDSRPPADRIIVKWMRHRAEIRKHSAYQNYVAWIATFAISFHRFTRDACKEGKLRVYTRKYTQYAERRAAFLPATIIRGS